MTHRHSREGMETERGMEDVGLAAGRSQREKKRSYKDLLREEEETAEQVRKSSKKRPTEADLFFAFSESHKKKKKHSSDDAYYTDFSSPDVVKKKKKQHPLPSPSSSDTAMDLLKAITSPLASSTKPISKKSGKVMATPAGFQTPSQPPRKEPHKKSREGPHEDHSHQAKKPKPLTLREPDGLRMKLILSPKEKPGDRAIPPPGGPGLGDVPAPKKSSKKVAREEPESCSSHKTHRRESHPPQPGGTPDTASSSGGELEAGELVIDDSFREVKKKKKSKKSKKKKDKHKEEKHKKHGKSRREPRGAGGSPTQAPTPLLPLSPAPAAPLPPALPPAPAPVPAPNLITHPEGAADKKKKKEEAEKPKKKNMSAYQVFSKEYRVCIIAEHPGI
ncbi:hypothetical protein FKM82_030040, partial [Ascaphus truei]